MQKLMISSGALALLATPRPDARRCADSLTLYCGADETWCQLMAKDFEAETGITVDMTRKSAGEIYAQVRPRRENPKGDVWWAGTGDPHLQAAEEELTAVYELADDGRAARLGGPAGRGRQPPHRRRLLRRARLRLQQGPARQEQPARAEVLGRPGQARVQGPHPGRQPELLGHRLHHARDDRAAHGRGGGLRVPQGAAQERQPVHQVRAPPRSRPPASARPRSASSSCTTRWPRSPPASRSCRSRPARAPATRSARCRSSPAPATRTEAKKFYDWALTADVQSRAQTVNSFQLPSNKAATQSPLAPDLSTDQADRLRLRQVRLERGAPAPARSVGRRGGLAAAIAGGRSPPAVWPLHPTVVLWMVVGLDRLRGPALVRGRRRLLVLRLAPRRLAARRGRRARRSSSSPRGEKLWLAPLGLLLLLPLLAWGRTKSDPAFGRLLLFVGAAGLALAPDAGLRHRPARLALRLARPSSSASSTTASSAWATAPC